MKLWKYDNTKNSIRNYKNLTEYHGSEEQKRRNRISTTHAIYSKEIYFLKVGVNKNVE